MIFVGLIGILTLIINSQDIIIFMFILLFLCFFLMMKFVDIIWAKHLLNKDK